MYLRTLLDGIAPVPEIDPEVRRQVREASVEENRARLQELDPDAAARLKPADKARIARALEVVLSTGRTLARMAARREGGIGDEIELRPLILLPPRDWLYRRCDERFARMMEQGAVEEVKALLARKLDPDLPVMRGIGVREIAAFLAGDMSREEAIAAGQQATRRYAKRQYTWFAHQPPPEWPRFREPLDGEHWRERWPCSSRSALGGARWSCCATPTSIPPRSPASASRSSATAIRAARRRSTCTTAGSTWSSACAALPAAHPRPKRPGSRLLCSRTRSARPTWSMMLAPDEIHGALYREIEPHLREGAALGFSHGLSVRFGFVEPRADLDVFLVAPKGPGYRAPLALHPGQGHDRLCGPSNRIRAGTRATSRSPTATLSAAPAPG